MTVLKVLNDVSDARFQKYYQSPPRQLEDKSTLQSIVCTHDAIYVAGKDDFFGNCLGYMQIFCLITYFRRS